jgi:nucleoside-diphosphate-sugar epimerase
MSRVLITGATGFVARGVIAALRADGHLLSGTTRQLGVGQGPERVPLYHVPSFDGDLSHVVAGADAVVHLAARTHNLGEKGMDSIELYRSINRDGSCRLAEAAATAGVRRFIYMSSVKAAAEETFGRPLDETTPPAPEDAYGISKWEAEQVLAEVAARRGLELVILRPPLVYGPNAVGNLLTLLKACDRRLPLPLAGIENRRSVISVRNLASAVSLTLRHPAPIGTYFVSDGEDISTAQMVAQMSRALGRRARLFPVPTVLLGAARRLPKIGLALRRLTGSLQIDSRLIRARLGWSPVQTLEAGFAEMAATYRVQHPVP